MRQVGGITFSQHVHGALRTASWRLHIFDAENIDDPQMRKALNEVRNAQVCLAKRVEEAKINTLKLRASIMGFVTAGNPRLEDQVDPVRNKAYRPERGKASYSAAVSYFLYQCVVETCGSN